MIKHIALSLLLSALFVPSAFADIRIGSLVISQPWARATPPGARVAGAYLTVTNTGGDADKLVSVTSSGAEKAELHVMKTSNGVMSMRPMPDGIPIPAGGSVTLSPNGMHIMLVRPKEPLRVGTTVPLRLTFAKAGSIDVELDVEAIGAKGPTAGDKAMPDETMPDMSMPGMKMDGMKMDEPAK